MAFPTIPTVAAGRVLTSVLANTTQPRVSPDLSGLTKNSGDLLIALCIGYQSSAAAGAVWSGWTAGWTEFVDNGGTTANMTFGGAYKWSTGAETGTISVTQAATVVGHAGWILLSIPGAHPSVPPEDGVIAHGTAAAADPGALSPSWGARDTLWLAVRGSGETSTTGSYTGLSTPPTSYGDSVQTGISGDVVGGMEAGVSFRQLNAASEDIGATGVADFSNARNSIVVIAVRPDILTTRSVAFSATAAITAAGEVVPGAPTTVAYGRLLRQRWRPPPPPPRAPQQFRGSMAAAVTAGVVERSASLSATASISAAPQRELQRSVAFGATATISAAGTTSGVVTRAASFSATATMSVSGARLVTGVNTGQLLRPVRRRRPPTRRVRPYLRRRRIFPAAAGVVERAVSLSATATITAAPQRTLQRSAALGATAAITAAPQRVLQRSAALGATATITAAGQVTAGPRLGTALLRTRRPRPKPRRRPRIYLRRRRLVAPPVGIVERAVSFSATATISAVPRRILQRAASFAATATISSVPQRVLQRAVTLTATASISAQGGVGQAPDFELPLELEVATVVNDLEIATQETDLEVFSAATELDIVAHVTDLDVNGHDTELELQTLETDLEIFGLETDVQIGRP